MIEIKNNDMEDWFSRLCSLSQSRRMDVIEILTRFTMNPEVEKIYCPGDSKSQKFTDEFDVR